MPFWEHIHELRFRLIKSLLIMLFFTLVSYFFSDFIIYILSQPKIELLDKINLQVLKITSIFMIKIYVSIISGFVLSLPFILNQIWLFISPAVNRKNNFFIVSMFAMSSVFFIIGAYFAYDLIVPMSILFFTSIGGTLIPVDYNITLENYMTYVIWIIFVGGIVFQLPIVSIIFKKLNVINHKTLSQNRRYSILIIFIVSALLTPPDPFSQILFVVPLILLYELSILIIRFIK